MFWKLLFPIVAHRYNFLEKWIHMFALVFGKYSQYMTLLRLLYIECTPEYYAITFKCKGHHYDCSTKQYSIDYHLIKSIAFIIVCKSNKVK